MCGMKGKHLYSNSKLGINLLALPNLNSARANAKRRNISDVGSVTASQALSYGGVFPDAPLLFCGSANKAFPILQQLVRMTNKPFILIGTERLNDSCLCALETSWSSSQVPDHLETGSGILTLSPDIETYAALRDSIRAWHTHFPIVCLGDGLSLDSSMLDSLNSLGAYCIITGSLQRSVLTSDKLEIGALLRSMEYVLISSAGGAAQEIVDYLPKFEEIRVTNTTDFSSHRDTPRDLYGHHPHNGSGIRISQSRVVETMPVIKQDELVAMQKENALVIYNTRTARVYISRIQW